MNKLNEDRFKMIDVFRKLITEYKFINEKKLNNIQAYSLAIKLENSIHNKVPITKNNYAYSSECFKILSNIKSIQVYNNKIIPNILDKLVNNEIDINEIGLMSSHELYPDKSAEIYDYIKTRSNQQVNKKYTTKYICPNCKARKAEFTNYNDKCADELPRILYTCTYCKYTW